MPQSTFINPVALPAQLNAAERKFVKCMAEGGECEIGTTRPALNDVIDHGDNPNVIRADVIRFFAWGGNKDDPIAGNTITLSGAHISGELDLLFVSSPYVLALMRCRFDAPVNMLHAEFRSLNLGGSHLPHGLNGGGMRIDGDVFMRDNFSAEGEVSLIGANVGGDVDCGDGRFKNKQGMSLVADKIKAGGNFRMRDNFIAEGEVRLLDADIGGSVDCDGGKFTNKEGVAFAADGIKVGGDLSMQNNFTAEGTIRLLGADIGGNVYCNGGKFRDAFCADSMKVSGSVFTQENFFADGEVQLFGAYIGGNWHCDGAIFQNEGGKAIAADRIRVGGNLHMRQGFFAKGEVRLSSAHIGGDFCCDDGYFDNKKGEVIPALGTNAALVAQGIQVGSSLLLDSGFYAAGAVVLNNAKIGNNVVCDGFFINKNNIALVLDDATIGSDLSLQKISARGEARLIGADIGGQLRFGGEVYGDVVAESAKVGTGLLWRDMRGKGLCYLSFASADVFDYDEESLRGFEFILDGFSYKRFAEHENPAFRLKWLNKRSPGVGFSPQPFEQAAKVLFAMGDDNDARKMLLEKERQLTQQKKFWRKPWQKSWRWLWDAFAGYGYRLRRTLVAAAAVVACGWGFFFLANQHDYIVPHQPVVLKMMQESDKVKDGGECADKKRPTEVVECLLPEHPKFYSLAYSLDVFIPLFALHQEPYWYPQPQNPEERFFMWALIVWYWIEIIAGWVLTSLLVLTITGLLKPRQSSLE